MEQIWIAGAGGPDVLELREAPDPVPGPGEVVIDVEAAGVNFADVLARMGMYPDAPRIPCVVGYEVSGVVRALGPSIEAGRPALPELHPGDRVMALTQFSGYSSVVNVPQNQVFRMPDEMSFVQAAAIPVNYFTAYLAISRMGNLQPDERILIHNAGGGVGIAAIQMSRHIGATVYGTASGWKHDRLHELGADELIDYRTQDWVDEVMRRTDGNGVHVIIDPIGGKNLKLDLRILAPLGRLVGFGFTAPVRNGKRAVLRAAKALLQMPRPHFLSLLNNNWAIGGLNLGHLWSEIDRLRAVGQAVLTGWAEGYVSPVVAAEIPFARAAEAHRMLQDRGNIGKVVLTR